MKELGVGRVRAPQAGSVRTRPPLPSLLQSSGMHAALRPAVRRPRHRRVTRPPRWLSAPLAWDAVTSTRWQFLPAYEDEETRKRVSGDGCPRQRLGPGKGYLHGWLTRTGGGSSMVTLWQRPVPVCPECQLRGTFAVPHRPAGRAVITAEASGRVLSRGLSLSSIDSFVWFR